MLPEILRKGRPVTTISEITSTLGGGGGGVGIKKGAESLVALLGGGGVGGILGQL